MKKILLLGATGSIGQSTLEVVRSHPDKFSITGMVAGSNVDSFAAAINEFKPNIAAIADQSAFNDLKKLVSCNTRLLSGEDGVLECVRHAEADACMSAIVGSAGLRPTITAIEHGMEIALANKETLVSAGSIVTTLATEKGVNIIPVDSEHSALLQCTVNSRPNEISKLIITASGGPFRGKTKNELLNVTPQSALAHPTWSMGSKVTIDSATLANKALETIEAHWLFSVPYEKIEIVVHPQSIVHGVAEFFDGSMIAQLGSPDMRTPIQYALSCPNRLDRRQPAPSLTALGALTFEEPDHKTFPMLKLGLEAGKTGGNAPAIYSAANEEAVNLFLAGKIGFCDIYNMVDYALGEIKTIADPDIDQIFAAEDLARESVKRRFQQC